MMPASASTEVQSSRDLLLQLQNMFASLYRTNDRALEMADQAGLDVSTIPQSPRPRSTWWNILIEADRQLLLRKLIDLACKEYPRHAGLLLAAQGKLDDITGPAIEWVDRTAGHEVVIGSDDLLPVAFLATGAEIAKSVVRIHLGPRQYGSGFLITRDVVLTNHHVLPTREIARAARIEVGYEETLAGVAIAGAPHTTLADELYLADEAHDWAVVKIIPVPACTPISLSSICAAQVDERVFIIQHPGGGPKQVSIGENRVTYVDATRIQYLTDTRPGSSGSPVFDRQWRLVAIHHSGGWLSEPNSKEMRFRNEGIAIGLVRDALVKAGLVAG